MKVLIDTYVLYPTVMREVVLGVAATGAFTPLWSARILEEWARAARKLGAGGEAQARGEIAELRADVAAGRGDLVRAPANRGSGCPIRNDVHVLAAAIAGSADVILTLNAKDFPRSTLGRGGAERAPIPTLSAGALAGAAGDREVGLRTSRSGRSAAAFGRGVGDARRCLKKARLPRLAKAVSA